MTAVPALVAGVARIAVVTPRPVAATLVVARELGILEEACAKQDLLGVEAEVQGDRLDRFVRRFGRWCGRRSPSGIPTMSF